MKSPIESVIQKLDQKKSQESSNVRTYIVTRDSKDLLPLYSKPSYEQLAGKAIDLRRLVAFTRGFSRSCNCFFKVVGSYFSRSSTITGKTIRGFKGTQARGVGSVSKLRHGLLGNREFVLSESRKLNLFSYLLVPLETYSTSVTY